MAYYTLDPSLYNSIATDFVTERSFNDIKDSFEKRLKRIDRRISKVTWKHRHYTRRGINLWTKRSGTK